MSGLEDHGENKTTDKLHHEKTENVSEPRSTAKIDWQKQKDTGIDHFKKDDSKHVLAKSYALCFN